MHPGNETEQVGNYAVLDEDGVITNVAWSGPGFAESMGWVRIHELDPQPIAGWRTPDGGATWEPPAEPEEEA